MKFLSTIVAFLLATTAVQAQDYTEEDDYMFNHMSFGLSAGTTGVGLDFTMPLGKYVQVRAGAVYIPPVSIKSTLDCATNVLENGQLTQQISNSTVQVNEVDIKSTPTFLNGKLMFDLYPSKTFPLHLTLGAYFGAGKIVEFKNVGNEERLQNMYSHISSNHGTFGGYENSWGLKMGNYTLLPDCNGTINSWIETSAIRPYAGLGWGKAYSEKGIDWMIEAGVIYWNKPKLYSRTTDLNANVDGRFVDVELKEDELCGNQGMLLKLLSKTSIYPVINFRIGFNMF